MSRDPSTLSERIDRACDRFESEWRNGHAPVLEEYSNLFTHEERPAALCELQGIDEFWRQRRGERLHTPTSLIPDTLSFGDAETPVDGEAETQALSPAAQSSSPSPGRRLGGYELIDEIGRGGMGIVYQARQVSTDRIVALKLIRGELLTSLSANTRQGVLDRFRQEVQAAARLEHDHIVTVYDGGETEGHLFLAMRFVCGQSLGHTVRSDGRLAPARAARYIASVARAVEAAHQAGIVHRDIKPRNLLLDQQTDRVLISDFGVAKLRTSNMTSTQQGEMLGTPGYMSPEQYQDAAAAGAPSDVYSLGATLYNLLTGEMPFEADTPWEMMRQVLEQIPPPPSSRTPGIDPRLDAICLRCLHKEAEDRYATAEALADDLDRYLGGEPVVATRSRIRRPGQTARRPRWVLAVGLVLVPVATVAATSVWEYTGRAKRSLGPAGYASDNARIEGALHDQRTNANNVDEAEQVLTGWPLEQATADVPSDSPANEVDVAAVAVLAASDWVSIDGIIGWGNDRPGAETSQPITDNAIAASPSDEPPTSDRRQPPPGVQWDRPLGSM